MALRVVRMASSVLEDDRSQISYMFNQESSFKIEKKGGTSGKRESKTESEKQKPQ